jgi:hypothetical protein
MLTTDGLLAKMKAASRRMAEAFDIQKIAARFEGIFKMAVARS